MKILGIDYGKRKVGLALADGPLAEPFKVLRYEDTKLLSEQLKKIVEQEEIDKIVVGISEGAMAKETRKFLSTLTAKRVIHSKLLTIPTETFDETLSTQDAQKMAIEAGVPRLKRKSLEDAFAAAVMLQSYLDAHV